MSFVSKTNHLFPVFSPNFMKSVYKLMIFPANNQTNTVSKASLPQAKLWFLRKSSH